MYEQLFIHDLPVVRVSPASLTECTWEDETLHRGMNGLVRLGLIDLVELPDSYRLRFYGALTAENFRLVPGDLIQKQEVTRLRILHVLANERGEKSVSHAWLRDELGGGRGVDHNLPFLLELAHVEEVDGKLRLTDEGQEEYVDLLKRGWGHFLG